MLLTDGHGAGDASAIDGGGNGSATKTDDVGVRDAASANRLRLAAGGLVGDGVDVLDWEARCRWASF